jgi:hypothetical protein
MQFLMNREEMVVALNQWTTDSQVLRLRNSLGEASDAVAALRNRALPRQ